MYMCTCALFSERTILGEFCGAHLSPHVEVVPWSKQVRGKQVLLVRVVDTGQRGVLVGPSDSLPKLREREKEGKE